MVELPRRTLLAGWAGTATLALTGCGTATGPQGPPGGGGQADLEALRLSVGGGFTTAATAFRTLPELVVTPDGSVLVPDPVPEIYPGPILLHLSARDLDPAGREALAEAVLASGLVTAPPPDFGTPAVADAPTTTLRVTLDGTETTLAANALAEAPAASGLTAEQERARDSFRALVERCRDLETTVGPEHLGEPVPYEPEAVWLRTLPAPTDRVGQEPEPTVLPWPVAEVDLARLDVPTLVEGASAEAVLAALEGRTELTWFRDPAGVVHEVLARPALPGDPPDGSL
jgi:hypothetical protein